MHLVLRQFGRPQSREKLTHVRQGVGAWPFPRVQDARHGGRHERVPHRALGAARVTDGRVRVQRVVDRRRAAGPQSGVEAGVQRALHRRKAAGFVSHL